MTSFNPLRRASRWWAALFSGHGMVVGLRALVCALAAHTALAQTTALPSGPQVVQGNASFAQTGKQLQVTNTPGAVINWQSFGIAPGHSTYFQQQSANSSVLNQVVTNNPSQIFGTLGSNGRVILVNPSGIVVGAGAVVDTAGFIASTLALTESNTALSRLRFGATGQSPGTLQVDGIIRSSQGDIILIAPNTQIGTGGVIKAADGTVVLAAGQQVLLTGRGLDGIALQLQAPTDQAVNLGRLEGNAVGLFAAQLRHTGVIQANTAELVGGRVVLRAVDAANVSGSVIAAGTGASSRGGVVTVEGRDVQLQAATVNASGTAGGGTVLIGGGWQGRDASVANSQNTRVDSASKIDVSGVNTAGSAAANAGTVVVWSDGNTRYAGQIDARGGAGGGNGGQVEVSGKENLAFEGRVRVDASKGVGGSILLDPKNIDILSTGSTITSSVAFGAFGTTTLTLFNTNLSNLIGTLAGSTLTLQATNDINVSATLNITATSGNLIFEAGRSINVNQPITFAAGNTANLTLFANSPNTTSSVAFRDAGLGVINMANASGTINMGGTATTVKLSVGNNLGGGGVITLGDISNVGSLIVDNAAVAGGSTGGIQVNASSTRNITDRIFLSTQRGSIGSAAVPFSYTGSIAPLPTVIGLAAPAGSAYIRSNVPIYLGPAPELGGAAANISGTLDLGGSTINLGARGTQTGSGTVTAGQLTYNTETVVVYSDSSNAAGPLVVNVGGIVGTADFTISPNAKVTTSLVVGTGGINITGLMDITGAGPVASAPAIATSVGDVKVGSLVVLGNNSAASLSLNGGTGVLKVLGPGGFSSVNVTGGGLPNAPASVVAKSIVVGTATDLTTVNVLGGDGSNSQAILNSSAGNIDILGVSAVVVGSTSAQTSSYSLLQATAGSVNINGPGSTTQILLRGGSGSGSFAEIASTVGGVNLTAGNINLSGGVGSQAAARVVSQGPVNVNSNLSTTLAGGTGSQASASITAGSATSIIGPLTLQGGSGLSSMAMVSTSGTITATGPITFDTSTAGTGSHALIYAGVNGIAFTLANGFTPTLVASASSTAAALSGVIVPPADVGITVQLPTTGSAGTTVSATITFSNPGLVTATFTPTLSVDGVTQTLAAVTLSPSSTVTTITTVLLGGGTSTVVNASTGIASWPEVNLSNNTASALITLGGVSDIQAFVLLPANAIAGTTVSATVTFTNTGPSSANNFTATVVVNGVTQTLTVGSIPTGGTFTTVTSVVVGTSGISVSAAGNSTTPDSNPGNNSASASGPSLVSDISSVVSLPSSAIAGTTASAVVTYTNLGSATTTFTPIVVTGGVTQTLSPVTLAPAGVFTTTTALLVGTGSSVVTGNVGANSVPEINTGNNFSSALLTPLFSDISVGISLPSNASAGVSVSGSVIFSNLGGATTTFSPFIVVAGATVTLAPVTLAPGGSFTTSTLVLVGSGGTSLSGGVGANSVPDSNLGNNAGSAFVAASVPPPPPPVTTPTAVVTTPTAVVTTPTAVVTTPTAVVTTPTAVVTTPTAVVTTPTAVVTTPTVVVTTPTVVITTPTVVITTPTVVITTPTVVVTTPTVVITTPTVVVTTPTAVVTTPTVVVTTPRPTTLGLLLESLLFSPEQVAALPSRLTTLLLSNQSTFFAVRVIPVPIGSPVVASDDVKPGDLPFCPRL